MNSQNSIFLHILARVLVDKSKQIVCSLRTAMMVSPERALESELGFASTFASSQRFSSLQPLRLLVNICSVLSSMIDFDFPASDGP